MSYRLLCLDAGFTILSPRKTLADALSGVLSTDGHHVTHEELRAAWEVADRWFWDEYHRPGNDTWTDDARIEESWRTYHGLMLERLGLDPDPAVLDRILSSQFATEAWEPYADVEPALAAVRAIDGVQVGIVSDWGSNLRGLLADLGLDRYFDFVLPSGAVGFAKPDPGFYRLALERAGVAPDQALMVGDSYRADVRGAWSAGMDAVWLDREEHAGYMPGRGSAPPDVRVIRSLDELPAIVRGGGPLPRGDLPAVEPAEPA